MKSFIFLTFCLCIFHCSLQAELEDVKEPTYLYFGYGSNVLAKRLHRTVNATRDGIGLLNNFRLDFNLFSKRWGGSPATIVPHDGMHVWTAIWTVTGSDLLKLDLQEGVADNMYKRIQVNAKKPDGTFVDGYTYMLLQNPKEFVSLDKLPADRQPSKAYMDVIISGAKESGFPDSYINMLKHIAHNNYDGDVKYNI